MTKTMINTVASVIALIAIVIALVAVDTKDREKTVGTTVETKTVRITGGAGRDKTRQIATEAPEGMRDRVETETSETTAKATTEEATETETEIPAEPVEVCTELPPEHDAVLRAVCEESGVPYALALGLIYTESRFTSDAVSKSGCYGYCQLNPRYFPSGLSPEDNIRHGIGWLGDLIGEYGDVAAALTAYSVGHDDGSRWYAELVMSAAEQFGG